MVIRLNQELADLLHLSYNLFPMFQVNKYAFSGGQDSIELHRKLGANLDVSLFPFIVEDIVFHIVCLHYAPDLFALNSKVRLLILI
jgi:hypothetical protein